MNETDGQGERLDENGTLNLHGLKLNKKTERG
jgi:hypothetical protein